LTPASGLGVCSGSILLETGRHVVPNLLHLSFLICKILKYRWGYREIWFVKVEKGIFKSRCKEFFKNFSLPNAVDRMKESLYRPRFYHLAKKSFLNEINVFRWLM